MRLHINGRSTGSMRPNQHVPTIPATAPPTVNAVTRCSKLDPDDDDVPDTAGAVSADAQGRMKNKIRGSNNNSEPNGRTPTNKTP